MRRVTGSSPVSSTKKKRRLSGRLFFLLYCLEPVTLHPKGALSEAEQAAEPGAEHRTAAGSSRSIVHQKSHPIPLDGVRFLISGWTPDPEPGTAGPDREGAAAERASFRAREEASRCAACGDAIVHPQKPFLSAGAERVSLLIPRMEFDIIYQKILGARC